MKKLLPILLTLCLMFGALTGCNPNAKNTPPVISGVNATVTVEAGKEFDALKGVTADDAEDGDITSKITVTSIPALTFTNGKTTPETRGTYELTYSVKDASGEEAQEFATLTVTPKVAQEELYKNFEFVDKEEVNLNGWGVMAEESIATGGVEDGMYVVDVKSIGALSNELKFGKTDFNVVAGTKYELKFYMKTTAATDKLSHVLFEDAKDPAWAPEAGSGWNLPISNTWKVYTYSFKASTTSDEFNIIIEFGKILEEAADFAPFKLMIQKIEIFSGEISGTSMFKDDYSKGIDNMSIKQWEGDSVAALAAVEGKPQINVTAASIDLGRVRAIQATTVDLKKDAQYKLVLKVKASTAFDYQLCVEDAVEEWKMRAFFSQGNLEGEKTFDILFPSLIDLEKASVVLYLGKNAAVGTITIIETEIFEIDPNTSLDKSIQKFHPNNKETDFDCFNGTDENLETGVGTMYMKDGKMYFNIVEVGGTDYFNKIFTNSTSFEGNALYRIEITAKANVETKCWFAFNKKGSWPPRVEKTYNIGTTSEKVIIEINESTVTATNFELLFSFGFPENKGKGDITIEFSEIKIIKKAIS